MTNAELVSYLGLDGYSERRISLILATMQPWERAAIERAARPSLGRRIANWLRGLT